MATPDTVRRRRRAGLTGPTAVRAAWGLPLFLGLVSLAGCSTLPAQKAETVVVNIQREAADASARGDEAMAQYNYPVAEDYYRRSYEGHARVDNLEGMANARTSLAWLYLSLGRTEAASETYREVLRLGALAGRKDLTAQGHIGLARVNLALKHHSLALEELDKAQDGLEADSPMRAIWLHTRALALRETGQLAEATSLLEEARRINQKHSQLRELGANHYLMASLAWRQDQDQAALEHLAQALMLDKKTEAAQAIATDLLAIALVLAKVEATPSGSGPWQPEGEPVLWVGSGRARDFGWRAFQAALADNNPDLVRQALSLLVELDSRSDPPHPDLAQWQDYLKRLDQAQALDTLSGAKTKEKGKNQ